MRHTEPDYYGKPSLGCLIALSLSAVLVMVVVGCYWLGTYLAYHLHF